MGEWDFETSWCPYDPESSFGATLTKLCTINGVTQEDIDALEDMARERTALLNRVKGLETDLAIARMR